MLFLGRLTAINHSYFEKLSSIVRVDASYVLVCFGPGSALEFRPLRPPSAAIDQYYYQTLMIDPKSQQA